jgi:hypothetical protein
MQFIDNQIMTIDSLNSTVRLGSETNQLSGNGTLIIAGKNNKVSGDYSGIFWGAHAFCRHSVLGMLQTAEMTPTLPGDERYSPGAHSIGNVWKMTGKGDTRIGSGFW